MQIQYISRAHARALRPKDGDVLISIYDRSEPPFEPEHHWVAIHRVRFHDCLGHHEGLERFTSDMARGIYEFVDQHRDADQLYIHCHHGERRSGAIAKAISAYLETPYYKKDSLPSNADEAMHNSFVAEVMQQATPAKAPRQPTAGPANWQAKVKRSAIAAVLAVVAVPLASAFYLHGEATSLEVALAAAKGRTDIATIPYQDAVLANADVPDDARHDIKEAIFKALHGGFGPNGAKHLFQLIIESNPDTDLGSYQNIRKALNQGAEALKQAYADQQKVLAEYEELLNAPITGLILKKLGFPSMDIGALKKLPVETTDPVFFSQESD